MPKIPRGTDGKANGAQLTYGIAALFDVAGEIRNRFIALQEQVRINQGDAAAPVNGLPASAAGTSAVKP